MPNELVESSHVHLVYLPTPLAFVSGLPRPLFLLLAPLKVLHAAASLLWALAFRIEHAPAFMLVQVQLCLSWVIVKGRKADFTHSTPRIRLRSRRCRS